MTLATAIACSIMSSTLNSDSYSLSGVVFGSDSKPLEHNHIQRFLAKSKKLRGKPKMIFIQACQGESPGTKAMEDRLPDIATDDDRISEYTDFYLSCASVAGDRSYRDIFTGTHSIFHSWTGGGGVVYVDSWLLCTSNTICSCMSASKSLSIIPPLDLPYMTLNDLLSH